MSLRGVVVTFLSRLINLLLFLLVREDGSVRRYLEGYIGLGSVPPPRPDLYSKRPGGQEVAIRVPAGDVVYDELNNLKARVFFPPQLAAVPLSYGNSTAAKTGKYPVIIYFHGGGFVLSSPFTVTYNTFGQLLAAKTGAIVVSPDYRLAPEHKCPTAFRDGFQAVRWVIRTIDGSFHAGSTTAANLAAFGDYSRIFLTGESAGGNLMHQVALSIATHAAGSSYLDKIQGLINLYPFFGGKDKTQSEITHANGKILQLPTAEYMWNSFLPSVATKEHPCSSFRHNDKSAVRRFPPLLLIVGGKDLLHDRGVEYGEFVRGAGGQVRIHVFDHDYHARLVVAANLGWLDELKEHFDLLHDFVQSPAQQS